MAARHGIVPPKHNPDKRLWAAVAVQAIKDLHDPNPLTALDALGWLIDDRAAEVFDMLDICSKDDIFDKAVSYGQ